MYVFAGQTSLRDTEPYDRSALRADALRARAAAAWRQLDAAGHALVFEDGSRLGYDKLLLAVGSKGRAGARGRAPRARACTTS